MPPIPRSTAASILTVLGDAVFEIIDAAGDLALFTLLTFKGLIRKRVYPGTLLPNLYSIGVRSVPVIAITGTFIGMVLAVQSYDQFHNLGLATQLGSIVNETIITELGPVLAATMLAGRIGSAMAAELATMRINEQIDALSCLGVEPHDYLVGPRFIGCVTLIPLLTALADFMGVMGGGLVCIRIYHVPAHHYWEHARAFVRPWDMFVSLFKPIFFGSAIAIISCYQGFKSPAGSEGVGRASTDAFVRSFIAILVLDLFLNMFLNSFHETLWPATGSRMF
jgi:phospholipid/cholesterol/gamma-HCH transport system permease protein